MSVNDLLDLIKNLPVTDTWGPAPITDNLLNGVPYMPYSKSDKLGRMADWTDSKDRSRGQFSRGREQQSYGVSAPSNPFAVVAVEEESSFSVVDNNRTKSTRGGFGRGALSFRARGGRGGIQSQRGGRGGAVFQRVGGRNGPGGDRNARNNRGGRRSGWRDDKPQRNRDSTVNVLPSWELVEEMDFLRLSKLNLDIGDGETIEGAEYGFLHHYDRDFDKNFGLPTGERKLQVIDRAAYNVTTSSDPIIQDLAKRGDEGITVYATDNILSVLMCTPRSVHPWDVVITRQGNNLFIDKRDESNLDVVTVNENASDNYQDVPDTKDPLNNPAALILEATHINNIFPLQLVRENKTKDLAQKNPFYNESAETDAPASKAYRYRTFDLSLEKDEQPVYLTVRTELDALVQAPGTAAQFATIKALNESPSTSTGGALDWRRKLATNRGAVVATEMKNNSCKLARWTTQALLADADILKLGFVTRVAPKNNNEHLILGVFGSKPRDFASQMNLSMPNGWGIVRTIIDLCVKLSNEDEPSKFVIVKDPNGNVIRLYKVPDNAFDEEEEESQHGDEEEDDEEEE